MSESGHNLTAMDVRNVQLKRPPFMKRGYGKDEVDAFMDLVEEALQARLDALAQGGSAIRPLIVSLLADDVRDVAFSKPPLGKRGYDESQVDAFLERVETCFRELDAAIEQDGGTVRTEKGQLRDRADLGPEERKIDLSESGNSLTTADVHNVKFNKPPSKKRGYSEDQVDAFMDLVEEALQARLDALNQGGSAIQPLIVRVLADDVRDVAFSKPALGRRGYDENDVDPFLDRVETCFRQLDAAIEQRGGRVSTSRAERRRGGGRP